MAILVIWEINPESVELYYFESLSTEDIDLLKGCHGKYVDVNMTAEQELWISMFLEEHNSKKLDTKVPLSVSACTIIMTGQVL